jgi:predicted nucleic acid-binding protein
VKTYVLDANALLIFLLDRPGANRVAKILQQTNRREVKALMSAVNWGEVVYSLWKIRGEAEAKKLIGRVEQLPLTVVSVDPVRAMRSGELKTIHGLGYADSFAAQLALELGATLVTADLEFGKAGKKLKVLFLPQHGTSNRG